MDGHKPVKVTPMTTSVSIICYSGHVNVNESHIFSHRGCHRYVIMLYICNLSVAVGIGQTLSIGLANR